MEKFAITAACLLLVLVPFQVVAQDEEEDDVSPIAFQGRVGGVYTGGDPFKAGATFEGAALIRFTGPLYFTVMGGSANFESDGDLVPITDEFAQFWEQVLETNEILNNDIRFRLNFVSAGATFIGDFGKLSPQITGGVGAYQVKFVTTFRAVPKPVPPPDLIDDFAFETSLEDSEWFLGYNFGGGLYYKFNKIVHFGGSVIYHAIDTDAIEDLVSFSFGMHINIP